MSRAPKLGPEGCRGERLALACESASCRRNVPMGPLTTVASSSGRASVAIECMSDGLRD